MEHRQIIRAQDVIDEASADELAPLLHSAIARMGAIGHAGAVTLLATLKSEVDRGGSERALIEEGLAMIEAVDGVITGRTDSL